MIAEKKKEKK